ncbi:type II toxin-antitoxin system RelE/ParE family toxin [Parabacteroides chinchillae]
MDGTGTCSIERDLSYHKKEYSESVAVKLFNAIVDVTDNLSSFPEMAPCEQLLRHRAEGFRSLVQGYYKIIYYKENDIIYIAMLWDCRQNPIRLIDKFK